MCFCLISVYLYSFFHLIFVKVYKNEQNKPVQYANFITLHHKLEVSYTYVCLLNLFTCFGLIVCFSVCLVALKWYMLHSNSSFSYSVTKCCRYLQHGYVPFLLPCCFDFLYNMQTLVKYHWHLLSILTRFYWQEKCNKDIKLEKKRKEKQAAPHQVFVWLAEDEAVEATNVCMTVQRD